MRTKDIAIFLLFFFLLFPLGVFGKIGVGVGTAKIELNEALNPGSINSLPSLSVVNTGDEAADYEVGVEYQENVSELRPQREWFVFKPEKFHLEPKESRMVEISLYLPVKTVPGDYFAYIEGRPLKKSTVEGTSVGIAAAAKLYFTVTPANFLSGIYYRLNSLWNRYAPWTYVVTAILLAAVIIAILSRFITLNIGIGKKNKTVEKRG